MTAAPAPSSPLLTSSDSMLGPSAAFAPSEGCGQLRCRRALRAPIPAIQRGALVAVVVERLTRD
jgi:hypothetical protein